MYVTFRVPTIFANSILYNKQVATLPTRYAPHEMKLNIHYGGRIIVNSHLQQKLLLLRIEQKKQDMYRKAKSLGFTHPIVVTCSQELDELLNRYQRKVS